MSLETLAMGGGPILLGVVIALTAALRLPNWLQYLWASIAVIFGIGITWLF
jgi:hypothetical protein